MITKKEQELLLPSAQHHSVHFGLATALSTAMIETPDGEYLLEAAGKRALRIAVESDLAEFAMAQSAGLKSHASRVFDRQCASLDHIAARAQNTGSSEYVGEFHHLLKDRLADQLLEIDGDAVRQMRNELSMPLPSERPKSKRGPFARLFSEDE
jgi:hypothetical protein